MTTTRVRDVPRERQSHAARGVLNVKQHGRGRGDYPSLLITKGGDARADGRTTGPAEDNLSSAQGAPSQDGSRRDSRRRLTIDAHLESECRPPRHRDGRTKEIVLYYYYGYPPNLAVTKPMLVRRRYAKPVFRADLAAGQRQWQSRQCRQGQPSLSDGDAGSAADTLD